MIRRPLGLRIRARLALVFTLLVGVIVLLVGVATYQLLRQSLLAEIERDVEQRAEAFAGARAVPPYSGSPYDLDTFGAPDVFLQVVGPDGEVLARSGNLGERSLPTPDAARSGDVVEVRLDGRPLMLTAEPLADRGWVVLARSPSTTYQALSTLRGLLIVVVAGALLITAVASWLYARAALRPVDRLVAAARAVRDSRDLAMRVDHAGPPDEVGRLAATFNEMLAELQDAHRSLDLSNQRLRQFLADCSHELRAPLTRIRSSIDLLSRIDNDSDIDDTDEATRSRTLADMAADTDRMARMVRQLLILARADAGATITLRPIRLADTLAAAYRQAHRASNGLTLRYDADAVDDVTVLGDAEHLEQLWLILLDNAIKFTPSPGEVRLTATRAGDRHIRIDVTDTGLGVCPEDQPKVFDRFYRGRNASAATGTGLGLAIAAWIADQHRGTITLYSTPHAGSRFSILLPLAPASAQA
jgi:two-component system, OmpR family, sensor kinase